MNLSTNRLHGIAAGLLLTFTGAAMPEDADAFELKALSGNIQQADPNAFGNTGQEISLILGGGNENANEIPDITGSDFESKKYETVFSGAFLYNISNENILNFNGTNETRIVDQEPYSLPPVIVWDGLNVSFTDAQGTLTFSAFASSLTGPEDDAPIIAPTGLEIGNAFELFNEQAFTNVQIIFAGNNNDSFTATFENLSEITVTGLDDVFLAGDYDRDGMVTTLDYQIWRSTYGGQVMIPGDGADGNRDGLIDAADYVVWRDNLENGMNSIQTAEVPEPYSAALIGAGALVLLFNKRRSPSPKPLKIGPAAPTPF